MANKTQSPMSSLGGLHLGIVGAAMDTQNLGVSALAHGTIRALEACAEVRRVTVFDYGRGAGPLELHGSTVGTTLDRCGLYWTRRVYRPESIWRIRLQAPLGLALGATHQTLNQLDGLLDVSGGDSFSDIYGKFRFRAIAAPKHLALSMGIPLVLMPQTYGPFSSPRLRSEAAKLCQNASVAFARDRASFERLKELLGDMFDSTRHSAGVDMSFAMPPVPPSPLVQARVEALRAAANGGPVIGLNVSGLVLGLADGGVERFGFRTPYSRLVYELCCRLVRDEKAQVALVPHVLGNGQLDADPPGNATLLKALPSDVARAMVEIHPDPNPAQAKGLISQFDWFCGTRMHATIAALSTETPVASIVYSSKAAGVFASCGMQEHAIDPRALDGVEVVDRVISSFRHRNEVRERLEGSSQSMATRVQEQTQRIVNALLKGRACRAD